MNPIPASARAARQAPRIHRRERGAAALAVALTLLVMATILAISVVNVGVDEQRNVANEVRNREASTAAESAMERAAVYMRQNRSRLRSTAVGGWMEPGNVKWVACTAATTTVPCGDGYVNLYGNRWAAYTNVPNILAPGETPTSTFSVHYLARNTAAGAATPSGSVFMIVGQGQSGDATGASLVKQGALFLPAVARAPDSPIIAAGTVNLSGTISVVANPNGGGVGVPLSVWSGDNVDQAGSMQTCHVFEYLNTDDTYTTVTDSNGNEVTMCPQCSCPNSADLQLTHQGQEGLDVVDVDGDSEGINPDATNFPDDVFQYTFGVPEAEWQQVKDKAQVIADCASLGPTSSGLYWITGDCSPDDDLGSLEEPVILVVDDGRFIMNANDQVFGLVFAFDNPDTAGIIDVKINGGPTLYGALISNKQLDMGNGSFTARYDRAVLENLSNPLGAASSLGIVPGSWHDY